MDINLEAARRIEHLEHVLTGCGYLNPTKSDFTNYLIEEIPYIEQAFDELISFLKNLENGEVEQPREEINFSIVEIDDGELPF